MKKSEKNISLAEAAARLGKDIRAVRAAMRQGSLPIGFVVKGESRCSYHILADKLENYMRG